MNATNRKHRGRRRLLLGILLFIAVIAAIRIALPYIMLHYANQSLSQLEGYRGHIDDIDLALIRGAYNIDNIYINEYDSATQKETPFLAASSIDLSIEWRSLLKGSLVGQVIVDKPVVRFTKKVVEPDDVAKDSTDFRKVLEDLMPLKINRLEFRDGELQYVDNTSRPRVDISMTDVDIVALNLRNTYEATDALPAHIDAQATVYDGRLDLRMDLNPLAEVPTFDLNAEWKNTNLVKLNDFFQAYAKVDVNKGSFGLYAEVAAKEGRFTGYVKPLVEDIDVLGKEDRDDNILRKAWESVAGTVTEIFENQAQETFATKIPLEGEIENPRANIFFAILQILENAFISALQPSIDREINLAAIDQDQAKEEKGLLEKVFGGDKDENKKQTNDGKSARAKRREAEKDRKAEARKKKEEKDRG